MRTWARDACLPLRGPPMAIGAGNVGLPLLQRERGSKEILRF